MIKLISSYAHKLNKIEIKEDQLIYCIDTQEVYFDISPSDRIQIGCTIQLNTEYDLKTLSYIQQNKIYIVKESNRAYRYVNNDFVDVITRAQIIDLLILIDELIPTTLSKEGQNIAPKTLASLVYTNSGESVEDVLKGMVTDDRKVLLYTRTEHVVATTYGQRVFNIPFPIPNYDLAKFPMLVIYKDGILPPSNYAISNDQIILSNDIDGLDRDEILTFVFHYNVLIQSEDNLNAESINNVRFFVGENPPYPMYETDVWFDTKKLEVKQFTNGEWKIIIKSNSHDDYPFFIAKNTNIVTENTNYIEIGVPGFDPTMDTLLVYENSIYLEEREDYQISADGNYIVNINDTWIGTKEEPVIINFVVFKAVNRSHEARIIKKTAIINKETNEIEITNFDKYKDTLAVYENTVYIEEGLDYTISYDSSKIIKTNDTWEASENEPMYFNFVIYKNSIPLPDDADRKVRNKDEKLRSQILSALGINEDQFAKIKELLL